MFKINRHTKFLDMEFKRTFHPVGQGAFFTEHLNNNRKEYGTTIVYDCGSTSSRKQLYREIEDYKKEQKNRGCCPFNVLFISHFDADHINGLKKLLEKDIADSAFIEELLKTDVLIKESEVEYMIKRYLIILYPEEYDCIIESQVEDLFKKYSIEKSLIEKMIYECDKDLERNTPFLMIGQVSTEEIICEYVNKVIDEQKRKHEVVIIPFLYPHLIKILLPEMRSELSEDTYEALDALFHSGIKIIGLDYNDNYRGLNEIDRIVISKDKLFESDLRTIKSFTRIDVEESEEGKVCWHYMPYNTIVDDGRKERFLVEFFLALQKSTGKIGKWFGDRMGNQINSINDIKNNNLFTEIQNYLMDGVSKFLTDKDTLKEFVNLLKGLYNNKNVSSGIRGVSSINVNSLNVLSYSDDSIKHSSIDVSREPGFKLLGVTSWHLFADKTEISKQFLDYCEQMKFYNYSCLYTGDCVMENHFYAWIDYIYKRVLKSPIGLLQIPHHGSKHNYDDHIEDAPIFFSFVNFKKGIYTFANGIYSMAKKIPCFEITQDDDSKYEHTVIWNTQK